MFTIEKLLILNILNTRNNELNYINKKYLLYNMLNEKFLKKLRKILKCTYRICYIRINEERLISGEFNIFEGCFKEKINNIILYETDEINK